VTQRSARLLQIGAELEVAARSTAAAVAFSLSDTRPANLKLDLKPDSADSKMGKGERLRERARCSGLAGSP
jgi:hypothetical protein